jgi:hypothetical protein
MAVHGRVLISKREAAVQLDTQVLYAGSSETLEPVMEAVTTPQNLPEQSPSSLILYFEQDEISPLPHARAQALGT